MKKIEMINILNESKHYFDYDTKYACNIKLHSQSDITDKMWQIATDEHLSEELWMCLSDIIEEFKTNTGYKVYTGGRSAGWIFLGNVEIVDENNTYEEVREAYKALILLEGLKIQMFNVLKALSEMKIVKKHYTTKHEYLTLA
jgi:hypothetical protein